MPQRLQPKPEQTVRVQAFDSTGRLVHDIDADARSFHLVTGVREHHGEVWLSSLEESALAVVSLPGTAV